MKATFIVIGVIVLIVAIYFIHKVSIKSGITDIPVELKRKKLQDTSLKINQFGALYSFQMMNDNEVNTVYNYIFYYLGNKIEIPDEIKQEISSINSKYNITL